MGGGAWPFLVGGVICLVNSDNERDLNLLNSYTKLSSFFLFLLFSFRGGRRGKGGRGFSGQLLRGTVSV